MSSRCRLARLISGLVVGVEVLEDHTGQTAFEAAQCFGGGGTGVKSCAVVGLAESVQADLCDGDAVQGGVELTVAGAAQPDPTAVLPDHTGIGATPAWRAKAASLLNRGAPATSPTSLAAVNSPQPGSDSSAGATWRTRSPMRLANALIVSRVTSVSSSRADM
jgi:hypothetical protein